jgi:hypothetical protein
MALDRVPSLIEGPASVAGLNVEKGLSNRIIHHMKNPEALPLLAHSLSLLHQRGATYNRLAIADYETLGDQAAFSRPYLTAICLSWLWRRNAPRSAAGAAVNTSSNWSYWKQNRRRSCISDATILYESFNRRCGVRAGQPLVPLTPSEWSAVMFGKRLGKCFYRGLRRQDFWQKHP